MAESRDLKVSVVMPVYNHEAFLWSACESVLDQDFENLQLFCVDDGSTDTSATILEQVASAWPRSRFDHVSVANGGAHSALNIGIAGTSGDIVLFINSDDYYAAGRVSKIVRAMWETREPTQSWAFSGVGFIDAAGSSVDPADHGLGVYKDYMFHVAMGAWAAEILPWHNIVLTSGNLAVGRHLLERVGGFAPLRLTHDWDMALRLLAVRDPVILADPLYLYRFHGHNTFLGLDETVSRDESAFVHANWSAAVAAAPRSAVSRLPFVAHMRGRRGLRSAWDGA